MWTDFRITLGGVQEYFNVTPDLAVYSKACANGMIIALLTGRAFVFDPNIESRTSFYEY